VASVPLVALPHEDIKIDTDHSVKRKQSRPHAPKTRRADNHVAVMSALADCAGAKIELLAQAFGRFPLDGATGTAGDAAAAAGLDGLVALSSPAPLDPEAVAASGATSIPIRRMLW
jgi:hypothetical protein